MGSKTTLIISPKFEILGILWFWSGRHLRRLRTPIKACVSRNCDTNAHIKFIIDTAIDDLEWKNPIDFGANRKNQNGCRWPFCENMMKQLVHS